jgi:curved DNA-binding protein CbpA
VSDDPFAVLGLPTRPGLSDDDVRAGWRRIAAATHPDREDGGDPAGFGAAAAAYAALRTEFGRGEVLADLGPGGPLDHRRRQGHRRRRSTDSAARAGRHRAGREIPIGRRTGARLRGLARLRGWIARRAASQGPADATKQGPTGTAAYVSGQANWRPVGSRLWRRPERRAGGLALRVAGAAAVGVVAVVISGWSPGVVGVLAGLLTWLVATAGRARSRRRSR